jgi:glyoxylase-like metal-dependent hydrolase (beta-lactamase superfamily II)
LLTLRHYRLAFWTLAVLTLFTAAHAAAPQVKTQAPGYYRMMLGDFEVTSLSDGTLSLPTAQVLSNITPANSQAALARAYLKDPVETSVNAFLINTGSKLVLIDTGTGGLFGPTLGFLIANLRASGYQPEDVDEIYLTHMHGDHAGGLVLNGQRAFPNATVRADQREADYWLSQAHLDAAPAEQKDNYRAAMAALKPYVSAGKFQPFNGDTQLLPGIRAVPAAGHTPGHTIYKITSRDQTLVLWGDLIHVAAVQFPDPAIALKYDYDSKAAAAARKQAFAEAAEHGYWVGSAHLSFPGLGHLRAEGAGYAWVPVNYSALR